MPVLRSSYTVDAPRRLVAGVLRDTGAAAEGAGRAGLVLTAPVRLLVAGDEIRVEARGMPSGIGACRTRITRAGVGGLWSELAAGPAVALRHATTLTPHGDRTRVVDELAWTSPLGVLGQLADPVLRRCGARLLAARESVLSVRAADLVRARGVVGAAVVRDGRVLAACRSYPPELAGRWEVPGGSVEPEESDADAVRRECREELGTDVLVGERVGTDLPVSAHASHVLRVYRAALAPGAPEPVAREHRALRWVGPSELAGLGWLDNDRALLADLFELLPS